jgi:eukaryotic-like serine/threonine-protein kinase
MLACPDPQVLQRFLLGQVSEAEADPLEQHVARCPRCLQIVASVHAEDGFVLAMRAQARTQVAPPNEAVSSLIDRLARLPLPEAAAAPTLTGGGDTPSLAADPTRELFSFLAPPQSPDELGRLGGYRVLQLLGAGGMGVVFLAEDPKLRRLVALKAMRPGRDATGSARQRFLREAQATAALQHDHIVRIYQVDEDRGVPFLAMELLQGETLEARLQREGRLPYPEVLRIGRQIAEGLAVAHARGLIHRDIKPANVWLETPSPLPSTQEGGRVKIVDFGLVRPAQTDAALTRTGTVVGTPGYMAPEQAHGQPVDGRSDLFSLGCVLYRASTGEPPFSGPDVISTLVAVTSAQPPPPGQRDPTLPAGFSKLVMRLLAKRPTDRLESAAEVAAALAALEEASRPRPPLRWPWVAAAAVCLLGVAAMAGYLVLHSPIAAPSNTAAGGATAPLAAATAPLAAATGPATPAGVAPTTAAPEPAAVPREIRRLEGHTAAVERVAFLPGGHRAVSGAHDGTVRVWDLDTGQQVGQPLRHPGVIDALAVSADGRRILTAGAGEEEKVGEAMIARVGLTECAVRLWDLDKRKEIKTFGGHTDIVTAVAFLPGENEFLSCGWDGTIRLWDVAGDKESRLFDRPGSTVRCLAVSPDGTRAATGHPDGVIRLWDVATGKVFKNLTGHARAVDCLAFAPDGKRLVSGGEDKVVRVWDVEQGKATAQGKGHTERLWSVAVSPDGRRALSGSMDRTVRLWDMDSGKELHSFTGHTKGVQWVAFGPDGKRALSAGGDLTVRLWQLP